MAAMAELKELFGEWIVAVARAVDTVAGRFLRARQIVLSQGDDDRFVAKAIPGRNGPPLPDLSFRLDKATPNPSLPADWKAAFRGSSVEAVLQSRHVMFSPLDFPSQAGDFLDGMIRTQVDRLTPWSVHDAVFGWSQPTNTANDRIEVIFAATSKLKISASAAVRPCAGYRGRDRIRHCFCPRRYASQDQIVRQDAAERDRANGRRATYFAYRSLVRRSCRRSLPACRGVSRQFASVRAAGTAASNFAAPGRAAPRSERRRIGTEPIGEAQAGDAVERHGAGSRHPGVPDTTM